MSDRNEKNEAIESLRQKADGLAKEERPRSRTIGFNGLIGATPFTATKGVGVQIKNGVGHVDQKENLEGLEVIFGDGKSIRPGDVIWVDKTGVAGWGKKVFTMDGKQFVVCRPEHVLLVTHNFKS